MKEISSKYKDIAIIFILICLVIVVSVIAILIILGIVKLIQIISKKEQFTMSQLHKNNTICIS